MSDDDLTRANTSPVWTYFRVCEDNAIMADCMLCGIRMSRGGSAPNRCGTTNLRRHIIYSHNIHLPSAKNRSTGTNGNAPKKGLKKKPTNKKSIVSKKSTPSKKNQGIKRISPVSDERKKKCIKEEVENTLPQTEPAIPQTEPVMCIKWNTYLSNMTSALPHLLHDEQFVDVTLACEGQSLKCHKILLAACSPYFYDLLSASNCRHPIIMFKDYQFWELQALVAFMYCGEVNVPQSQLPRILHVAEALQIKGLAKPASKVESSPEQEVSPSEKVNKPSDEVHSTKINTEPKSIENKRRRRPSTHDSCCKSTPKAAKPKHKPRAPVKSRGKMKSPKRKVTPSPPKKLKLSATKKTISKKAALKKERVLNTSENVIPLSPSLSEKDCSQLPELMPNDMPDMFNDILALKDTAGITEGISLPVSHRVGSVDGIFPLEELEAMKMEMGEDGPESIDRFLANGLDHSDQFDLLPHINPECRLDEEEEERR